VLCTLLILISQLLLQEHNHDDAIATVTIASGRLCAHC